MTPSVLASALAMDKAAAKAVFRQAGLPVAEHRLVTREELEAADGVGAVHENERIFTGVAAGGVDRAVSCGLVHAERAADDPFGVADCHADPPPAVIDSGQASCW
jgi:hypothetical protein